MSEMKDMIVDVVERMLKEHVDKTAVDIMEKGKWSTSLWNLFVKNGITSVAISEENGGAGGDLDDLLNIVRLTGKYAAPIPFSETTLANFLLERMNLHVIEGPAAYMLFIEQAYTLADGKITGEAIHVPWARHAQQFITLAVDANNNTYLVETELSQASITPSANLANEPRDMVEFQDAPVTQLSVPLSPDDLRMITTLETAFRLALMTGAIDKINDLTIQYTKEREQFGRPIHRFQLVQQRIVHLAGETAVTLAAFHNIADALTRNVCSVEIAYARMRLEEAVQTVTAISHQVHAAIGTTHEHSLHQYTRRLWAWRDEGTSVSHWADIVTAQLIKPDGDSLWAYLTDTKSAKDVNG